MIKKKLPCKFQIMDDVTIEVPDNPGDIGMKEYEEDNVEPEYINGIVVGVKFTHSKVFYDILTDDTAELFEAVDSAHCKKPEEVYEINKPE